MSLRLGAPGVYRGPALPAPALAGVRLDVAGFVGVAPRGPVDQPVEVRSWTGYRRRFGDTEPGAGLLPHAVRAFFDQGGAVAHVVRVGPSGDPGPATARFRVRLAGDVLLDARDEGLWGDRLEISWRFDVATRFRPAPGAAGPGELPLPAGVSPPPGSLLRIRGRGLPSAGVFRWVAGLRADRPVALLDPDRPAALDDITEVAEITAAVLVVDHDPGFARSEELSGLGLRPEHPRAAGRVLAEEAELVRPAGDWAGRPVLPGDALLATVAATREHGGADRSGLISGASFFDTDPDGWPVPPAEDPADQDDVVHRGVDAMVRVETIGLLAVPDVGWPQASTDQIADRQRALCARADRRRRFVALLDVPRGLSPRAVARWRAAFDTSYAAAYHPWLGVVRPEEARGRAVLIPPSSFAAGVIAARERRLGLPWGAAGELASGAVSTAATLTETDHDLLHGLGVNVFRAERDGFRLGAARTLSGDPALRQLSVRRLMTALRLTVERECQWLVFEPATPGLRLLLRDTVTQLLRELFRQGAFAGRTEAESFFVRCDEALNPPASVALGRLVAEVGVAPAEPLEFLVVRVTRDGEFVEALSD